MSEAPKSPHPNGAIGSSQSGPEQAQKPEITPESLQHVVAGDVQTNALVPAAAVFEGLVVLQGETRIEGAVRGACRGQGRLSLGPGGRVEGAVECDEVETQGFISGALDAVGGVWLGPGSRIDGAIRSNTVAMDETAVWNGRAQIGSPDEGS